jgi:hypothetical protein
MKAHTTEALRMTMEQKTNLLDDVDRLLRLLESSGAQAYLHTGCGCEWGSRGDRMQGPKCRIDALLLSLRTRGR